MTSNTYQFNDYSITTSLFEMSVYVRVVNTLSFQCFEDNVDITQLNLPFNNKHMYDILSKCFNNDNKNYVVMFTMNKGVLYLNFKILFDGYFNVNFDFILPEIIMKSDSKMTLNLHRIEEENNKKVEFLENRIHKLEEMVEGLVNVSIYMHTGTNNIYTYHPLNSLELNIYKSDAEIEMYDKYCKIECFYQLNKLTLNDYYRCANINFSNKTLKILIIKSGSISSFENLDKLPSLEVIEIRGNATGITNANNIIPFLHKNIKKIYFFDGKGNPTKDKLIPHCLDNKIELIYT